MPCPACKSFVSLKYLRLHLKRSQNPKCQRLLKKLDRDLSSGDDSSDEEARQPQASQKTVDNTYHPRISDSQMLDNSLAIDTAGDFFGDYQPADFDGLDNENLSSTVADDIEMVRSPC
jgi:hypothetical protein